MHFRIFGGLAFVGLICSPSMATAAPLDQLQERLDAALGQLPEGIAALLQRHGGALFQRTVCSRGAGEDVRCHARVITDSKGVEVDAAATPNAVPAGFGPADLRAAYNITTDGTSTIAIVDAYGYNNAEADLGVYRAQFGLPPCTTANGCFRKVNQNGLQSNYPTQNTGWAQESALDLDMASAMCPGCKLVLVEANSATFANLAAAVRTAAAIPGVTVISNSYGGGERGSQAYEPSYNQPGKAVTVSTGDSGFGVEFPATSPHVIAVGGTHLVRAANARGWSETVWSGGGSGCSTIYAKPAFQSDPQCTRRMEADVSAVADPNTGVAVYGPSSSRRSSWMVFGGTSVSAPLVGGIYGVTGHPQNGAASLYQDAGDLNDVTSGNNGRCSGTYLCTAGPGYDGPTGLGTPNGTGPF